MAEPGRPPKYEDPKVRTRIVKAIRAGNYAVTACKLAGIGESTYYRWREEVKQDDAPEALKEFWAAVEEAAAIAEAISVRKVKKSDRAIDQLEYLARRFPERWSKSDRLDVAIPGGVRVYIPDPGRKTAPEE